MRRGSLLLVTVLGCSSPDPRFAACPATLEEPLVNAAVVESYLGLSKNEIRAVVQVTNGTGANAPLCSGAFVAPDWVVTAAHCLAIESANVVVQGDDGGPPLVLPVRQGVAHPNADVALLRVDPPDAGFGGTPLGLLSPDERHIAK